MSLEIDGALDLTAAMTLALKEARLAIGHGDVPIGCVIIRGAEIVASAHDERELRQDPTAHAEVIAISRAAGALGSSRLGGCTLVASLEPCVMCAGAIAAAGVDALVFATPDERFGACGSRYCLPADARLGMPIPVTSGALREASEELLRRFFQERRSGS